VIRGELTNLRAVERTDASTLHRWFNDPDIPSGWGLPLSPVSLVDVQRRTEGWLEEESNRGRPAALIVELLEGTPAGAVVITRYEEQHRAAELALIVGAPEHWEQGFVTDALMATIDTCFNHWNLHRIWLRSEAFNEALSGLAEQCEFQRDATLREASFFDGRYHDVFLYSLLSTDGESESEPSANE
jgi:RimJ/RimL family protein N-acetyltransferase